MWRCTDNQDVGLEAAIIERVRNSSLVKWFCAEDPTGLKSGTEATGQAIGLSDRRAVGERPARREGRPQGRLERAEVRMQT